MMLLSNSCRLLHDQHCIDTCTTISKEFRDAKSCAVAFKRCASANSQRKEAPRLSVHAMHVEVLPALSPEGVEAVPGRRPADAGRAPGATSALLIPAQNRDSVVGAE